MGRHIISIRVRPRAAVGAIAGEWSIAGHPEIISSTDTPFNEIPKGIFSGGSDPILRAFGISDIPADLWKEDGLVSEPVALCIGNISVIRPELDFGRMRFNTPAQVSALNQFLSSIPVRDRMETYRKAMDEDWAPDRIEIAERGLAGLYRFYEKAAADGDSVCFTMQV